MAITKLATEIKIGAAEVLWNGVTIGHTKEGQSLAITKDTVARMVDQFGTSELDHIVTGEHAQVEVQVAQYAQDLLIIAFPELASGTGDYAQGGRDPGQKLGDSAEALILRPYGATSTEEDVTLHKAVALNAGPIPYSNENDRAIPITFVGLVDTTKGAGNRLLNIASTDSGS